MNFQQLKIIYEAARRNFNLTEVGDALFTSPSGISRHIKDLEDELGIDLFVRKGKRFLGLTTPGKELLRLAERMLQDAGNIKRLAEQYSNSDQGKLAVATTHTQARYRLPQVVQQFRELFPRVHLELHQGSPDEIVQLLKNGQADIGIATELLGEVAELASFPYYVWHHAVVVPHGHPLAANNVANSVANSAASVAGSAKAAKMVRAEKTKPAKPAKHAKLTLARLAEFPLITYHAGFTGRVKIDDAFAAQGIAPDIIMSALDADVVKTYVELGLGVGIIACMAFNAERDRALQKLDADHLFPSNTTRIAVRRGYYLRGFALRFMQLCVPEFDVTGHLHNEVALA